MAADRKDEGQASPAGQTGSREATTVQSKERRGGLNTFSSLQNNRDYRFLWAGNLCANAAQWLQIFTIGWLVFEISDGSALHSVAVAGIRSFPILVIGPWAGVLADRWDRRGITIVTQCGLAVVAILFALLVASGQVEVWHAYVYMSFAGIGFAVKQPVRQALIANTVRRADLPNALALNAMTVTSMRLVGPLIGGLLIATVGFKWNFFFEASLYIAMVLLLLPMRTPYQEASTARRASMLSNLVEGIGYILKNQVMLRLTILNFIRTAVFMPLVLLLPVYTKEALDAGIGTGTAMIAVMGSGGLLATFIMATWGFFTQKGRVGLIALLAGSAIILALGFSNSIWISLPLMALMGLAQTHFIVSNQTLIQLVVPDRLRGRVSSVWHYESGLIPLAAVGIGWMADRIDINFALTAVGVGAVIVSAFCMVRFKDIRSLD